MAFDPVKNFAKVQVSQGYDAVATSIALITGDGAKLPNPATDGAFNLVWWNFTDYKDPVDDPNKEIVRCTARSGDTLTIARPQEGTTASTKNTIGKTYAMILVITAKTIQDIPIYVGERVAPIEHNILELYLENYFGGKNTPYQGLIFDGFSDLSKVNAAASTLASQAATGQTKLNLGSATEVNKFKTKQEITIYDGTNREEKIITAIITPDNVIDLTDADMDAAAGFNYSENDPGNLISDQGVVALQRKVQTTASGTLSAGHFAQIRKTVNVIPNIQHTIKVSLSHSTVNERPIRTRVIVDGVEKFSIWWDFSTPAQNVNVTHTPSGSTMNVDVKHDTESSTVMTASNFYVCYDFEISHTEHILTVSSNLANTYASGSSVKSLTVVFDTIARQIKPASGVGNGKLFTYRGARVAFQQSMAAAKIWLTRNWTARFNLAAAIVAGATSLTIAGDQTTKFAVGDTIDIYLADNTKRERKTLTAVSFATPNTTLTWVGGLVNAYGTADFVERVDSLPKLFIGAASANESYAAMIWAKTLLIDLDVTTTVEQNEDFSQNRSAQGGTGTVSELDQAVAQQISEDHTSKKLRSIKLKVKKVGAPTDNLQIKVFDSATVGAGILLGTSENIAGADLTTAYQDVEFAFASEITLTNGWHFRIERTGARDAVNYYQIASSAAAADFYPNGAAYKRDNNAWAGTGGNIDLWFTIFVHGITKYAEDEYSYSPATPNTDVVVKIEITRNDTALVPIAKRYGVSLNT